MGFLTVERGPPRKEPFLRSDRRKGLFFKNGFFFFPDGQLKLIYNYKVR
jgi:hypothetical protein